MLGKCCTQYASKSGKLSRGHRTGKGQFSFQSLRKTIPDHLTCLLRNLYVGEKATVRTKHGTTGSKLRKEYVKPVYCHSVYLTYMQTTLCKMLGWMKHKLESSLLGEISINLRYADDTTLMAECEEELKSLLMKLKEREKAGLNLNIHKTKTMASNPITS